MTSKTISKRSAPANTKSAPKAKASAKPYIAGKVAVGANPKAPLAKVSRVLRRDGTGHLEAGYASDLRAMSRASAEEHTVDRAFLRSSKSLDDPLAEELGEEAVMTMTSAEDQSDQLQDVEVVEEVGGPYEVSTGRQEFARGHDGSNPRGATREPFPKT